MVTPCGPRRQARAPRRILDLANALHEDRLIKDAEALSRMRRAAAISAQAHIRAMRATRPGRKEYEIEAELLHEFYRNGAQSPAYPCIVAGGANGCVLHYVGNNAALKEGDLLLIDAGCEVEGYASDITRTFPVNGKYSGAQKEVYEMVLAAQTAALAASRWVGRGDKIGADKTIAMSRAEFPVTGVISCPLSKMLWMRFSSSQ